MKRLIELANKIKDKDLREKTLKLIENPKISNSAMKYPKSDITKAPCWIGAHHNYDGGLIDHIVGVTESAIKLAEVFEKLYEAKINYDHLIAGALLHDIMKLFIMKKEKGNWNFTGTILDHAQFTAAELYARGFPEEVVHIAAAHGGDMGSSAANPKTIEALLVFYADTVDPAVETMVHGVPAPFQFLLMPKESEEK